MMSALLRDLHYAFRRMRSRVGFTLIAVISLGLGIGVNTAAFSLIDAIILRKTPIVRADRVAELDMAEQGSLTGPASYPDMQDLWAQSRGVFSQISISAFSVFPRDMGDHVETLMGELVNGDYFPLIGLEPAAGRLLGHQDDIARGAHPVVVLSYNYWKSAYNLDPSVVGKQLRLSGRMYTIVGVAPKTIEGLLPGLAPAVYAPIQMINELQTTSADELLVRGNHSYFTRVRLADGQSLAAAQAVIERFQGDMRRLHPGDWPTRVSLRVIPLSQIAVSPLIDSIVVPAATALMVVVGLVLIIACANLASFLLAQARDRRREIAVRLAIGASRRALVRQLLVESLVVALAGGVLGVVLSSVALSTLLHANLPIPLPINLDVSIDARVLTFVIGATVVAGVMFGLLPALQATRPSVVETLKNENAGGKPGKRLLSMRSGLVIAQTAASLVLLVTSALFLRSFAAQSRVDAGFGTAPAGIVWMGLPGDRYPEARRPAMIAEVERKLRGMPGVTNVGVIREVLLNSLGNNSRGVNVDGFEPPKGSTGFEIDETAADSGFFDAAGVKLVEGRIFNSSDTPAREHVAIINEVMAAKFWSGREAVGQVFRVDSTTYRVVGVTKTTKVRSLAEAPRPFFFSASTQSDMQLFWLIARSSAGTDAVLTTTRMVAAIHEIDPTLMIVQAKTMEQHLGVMLLPARLGAVSFALFAGLALVLATIGVYGVVRYAVARRGREVAIRIAVGALPQSVVRLLMREGITLVVVGGLIGVVVSIIAARGLQSLLYGVTVWDPVAFIGAPLVLISVGVLAAFLPARRASRVDPANVLRVE